MKTNILLRHGYIPIESSNHKADMESLATVMMNLSYYGFALNQEAVRDLKTLNKSELGFWWTDIEKDLKAITGDDRNIGDFVVYKNFPAEVLEKSFAEYWIAQILMYWGLPNELFTQEVEPREKLDEQPQLKVLRKAKKDTLKSILDSYLKAPTRWKKEELDDVLFLTDFMSVNFSKLAFKENMVALAKSMIDAGRKVKINTATDVLRLAAGLSDADISLREKPKFKSFKKPVRKFLLSALESASNLEEDVARRPEIWKRLFALLHPGDYSRKYPKVCKVMNKLYHDNLSTFNSKVEKLLSNKDTAVLALLSERPGEFKRRLVHTLDVFGDDAAKSFINDKVLCNLSTAQIISIKMLLETTGERTLRAFPPKGNWNKLQVGINRNVNKKHIKLISNALGEVLSSRLPKVKYLDESTKLIKLPSNNEVSQYSRGTVFPIPDNVNFIRTASYWEKQTQSYSNVWFDNGWNFFDEKWNPIGACCWTSVNYSGAAVFSGDPTNSKEMKGRAAQLIDLYPKKLLKLGVKYAVWNILCYSRIPFSQATDVFAALQWGTDPQKGKLFEPSRCQLSFQLTGNQLTKYICMIDLEKSEMVYLDANLNGRVNSAECNNEILQKTMPAFVDYLKLLPSVHDLFKNSVSKGGKLHVLYSDKDVELNGDSAYVFKPENEKNKFKSVDLNDILTQT